MSGLAIYGPIVVSARRQICIHVYIVRIYPAVEVQEDRSERREVWGGRVGDQPIIKPLSMNNAN